MAQKRLNKNLVLFLTSMGIVLSVAVVGIAAYQGATKDPEVLAAEARTAEAAKPPDKLRAAERYFKAYDARKEVKYLTEAARCFYEIGEIDQALRLLVRANNEAPQEKAVLEALLGHMWELKDIRFTWSELQQYSDRLLELEPNHTFALVCNSLALSNQVSADPENEKRSEQALAKAMEISPHDPEVAMRRADVVIEKVRKEIIASNPKGRQQIQAAEAKFNQARDAAVKILVESAEKNPGHPRLAIRTSAILAALRRLDEAANVVKRALEKSPDDPDLHLQQGLLLSALALPQKEGAPAPANAKQLAEDARTHLLRAVDPEAGEPALYSGYLELARLAARGEDPAGSDPAQDVHRRFDSALKILEQAIASTTSLKSVKATLNQLGRAQLHFDAFSTAMTYWQQCTTPEDRTAALKRARGIYEQANTMYPTWHAVPYMEGLLYAAENNTTAAIQALERANAKFVRGPWMPACERLAMLYREAGQYGEALRYADTVIRWYESSEGGSTLPPVAQVANKCELLNITQDYQAALDTANDYLTAYADNRQLLTIKAESLSRLGRTQEAQAELAKIKSDDLPILLERARVAWMAEDHKEAERLLREAIEKNPEHLGALQMLVSLAGATDRREAGRQVVASVRSRLKDPVQLRVVDLLDVALATTDENERDTKFVEIIKANPDPKAAAIDLFNFYTQRRKAAEANAALTELERLMPDDPGVLERCFNVALAEKQLEKAEKYAARLTQLNADHAKGATFRGRLELFRASLTKNPAVYEAALAALRDAELVLPTDSGLKVLIAQALLQSPERKLDEAREALTLAIEANPVNADAHKLLYMVYTELGREEEAADHLIKAGKLNPNDEFVQSRKQLVEDRQDPNAAIARREALRKETPEDANNLVRLGQLYAKTQDSAKAQECFEAALRIKPNDLAVVRPVAEAFAAAGRIEEADKVFRAFLASAQGRDKLIAHFQFAGLFERAGDQAAAFEVYREAERVADSMDPAQKRASKLEAAVQLAEFCGRLEMVKEMIDALRRALDHVDPASPETARRIRLRMVQGMFATRRLGDAEKEIDSFVKDYPDDTRGLNERARLLLARQQLDEAHAVYGRILEKEPDNALVLFMRGATSLDRHRFADAVADLTRAKRLRPDDFGMQHRLRLAQAYESLGDFEQAELELREMLNARPTDNSAADRLFRLYHRTRRFDKADLLAREFVAKQPRSPYWHYQLGRTFIERKEYSAAVEPLGKALDYSRGTKFPTGDILGELMTALVRANRAGEAVGLFEQHPERDSLPAMVLVRAAEAYMKLNRLPDALRQFERALATASRSSWGVTSGVAKAIGEALPGDEEVPFFEKLASAPADPAAKPLYQAAHAQALILAHKGKDALPLLEPLTSLPDPSLRVGALELKSMALADQPEQQVIVFEQILSENQDNAAALNNIAYILADRLNRPKEALPYAERAQQLTGPDPNVLDTLAWVRFQSGDVAGAETALGVALRLDPDLIPARYHLGRLYAQQKLTEKARQQYDLALTLARKTNDEEHTKLIQQALDQLR